MNAVPLKRGHKARQALQRTFPFGRPQGATPKTKTVDPRTLSHRSSCAPDPYCPRRDRTRRSPSLVAELRDNVELLMDLGAARCRSKPDITAVPALPARLGDATVSQDVMETIWAPHERIAQIGPNTSGACPVGRTLRHISGSATYYADGAGPAALPPPNQTRSTSKSSRPSLLPPNREIRPRCKRRHSRAEPMPSQPGANRRTLPHPATCLGDN
jgi:hypothetical protein